MSRECCKHMGNIKTDGSFESKMSCNKLQQFQSYIAGQMDHTGVNLKSLLES